MGSLVLGCLLVWDVGSLLILGDQPAFSTAHFHSLSIYSSSVSQKIQRNFFCFKFWVTSWSVIILVNVVLNDIKNYSKKQSSILGSS